MIFHSYDSYVSWPEGNRWLKFDDERMQQKLNEHVATDTTSGLIKIEGVFTSTLRGKKIMVSQGFTLRTGRYTIYIYNQVYIYIYICVCVYVCIYNYVYIYKLSICPMEVYKIPTTSGLFALFSWQITNVMAEWCRMMQNVNPRIWEVQRTLQNTYWPVNVPVMWLFCADGNMFGSIFVMGSTWQTPPNVGKDPSNVIITIINHPKSP